MNIADKTRLTAVVAASVLALAACGTASSPATTTTTTSSAGTAATSSADATSATSSATTSNSSMPGMVMPTAPAGPHNQADITFAQEMTVHHQGAFQMADLAPTRASSSQVKSLAAKIKAAQAPEIAEMTGWLAAWAPATDMNGKPITTAPGSSNMGGMAGTSGMGGTSAMGNTGAAMPGMMTDQQMGQLTATTGSAFDKMFLQLMIGHHQGALTMAQTEKTQGSSPAAVALANSIIASQTAEITTMQTMLQSM